MNIEFLPNLEPEAPGGDGNTKVIPPRVNQCKLWFFTFNNYEIDDIIKLETKFRQICKKFVFQEEIGKQGTPHLQGNIWLLKKMRPTEFGLSNKIHWEKTRNEDAAADYCRKSDTSVGVPHTYGFPKPLKIITILKPWQAKCEDFILNNEPDDRTIYWLWETTGNIGKSSFIKYMAYKHNCLFMSGGKTADLLNIAFNADLDPVKCIFIDLPRTCDNIPYETMECFKNGMICNTKYETGTKLFNSPHLFVFANYEPEVDKLSLDRWKIININNNLDWFRKNDVGGSFMA